MRPSSDRKMIATTLYTSNGDASVGPSGGPRGARRGASGGAAGGDEGSIAARGLLARSDTLIFWHGGGISIKVSWERSPPRILFCQGVKRRSRMRIHFFIVLKQPIYEQTF